jgi:hypothetical protein
MWNRFATRADAAFEKTKALAKVDIVDILSV